MARNQVKLTTYLGTIISVDDEVGKFSARLSNGMLVEERTLSKVKSAIDNDEPTATVMSIQSRWISARKETISRSAANQLLRSTHTAETGEIYGYFELNEYIIARLQELSGQEEKERRELGEKYNRMKKDVLNKGTPLTPARLNELLDEDAKRKASRQ